MYVIFFARRGKPMLIWSDHGTNYVGAAHLLTELHQLLHQPDVKETITTGTILS